MLRQLSVMIALACTAQLAFAAEAGRVLFVAGSAQVAEKQVSEGALVQEGDLLVTGPTGFIYVKTIDNGLFILRPNTKARIAAYHVDAKNPANTRIKLELLSGVARSRSGEAVKLARQNFRFNTPVAAIGVRGTDFTVFTDQDTSRVAVISGGIVVSGFGATCRPEGVGPCEGGTSRELSAAHRGVLLQIQRGKEAPQLMQGGALGPDQLAPPRVDEPIGKNSGVNNASTLVSADPSLDAKKGDSINQAKTTPPPPPVVTLPPSLPPVATVPAEKPDAAIYWGRWQPLLNQPVKINLPDAKLTSELLAVNGNFVLLRQNDDKTKPFVSPTEGKIGFNLNVGEAYVYTDTLAGRATVPATLSNGKLNVDFGARTFQTSVDLNNLSDSLTLQAKGTVGADGRMYGDQSHSRLGYIDVQGAISNDKGGSAAYIFNGRLDAERTVNGVTYWNK